MSPTERSETVVRNPRVPFTGESEGVLLWPPQAHLVDDMEDCYLEWRESADAVADAYRRWDTAPRDQGALLFAAYLASLDQEALAAVALGKAVADVERWLKAERGSRR
jgi:hypothetical protein